MVAGNIPVSADPCPPRHACLSPTSANPAASPDASPTPPSVPTPTPSQVPPPTPSPVPSPTASLVPSPAPSPAPSPDSSPAPPASSNPASTPGAPAVGSWATLGPRALSTSAGATPLQLSRVAAVFVNAPYLNDLLAVLEHPVSAQPPDLRHFRGIALVMMKRPDGQVSSYVSRDHAPAPGLITFGIFGVALSGCAGAAWLWRRRGWRHHAAGALVLMLLPAVVGGS